MLFLEGGGGSWLFTQRSIPRSFQEQARHDAGSQRLKTKLTPPSGQLDVALESHRPVLRVPTLSLTSCEPWEVTSLLGASVSLSVTWDVLPPFLQEGLEDGLRWVASTRPAWDRLPHMAVLALVPL